MATKHVVVSLRIRYASSREQMSGIFNRLDAGLDWKLDLALSADELRGRIAAMAGGERVDGFILTDFLEDDIVTALAASEIPVVTTGIHDPRLRRRSGVAEIHNDGAAIGRLAAEYFTELGSFASRGYVHVHDNRASGYSDQRLAGFGKCEVFESPFPEQTLEDTAALGGFLRGLARPAAVLCACDRRALDVMRAAQEFGIRIPQQLSVIGVDNDDLFCSHSNPPLTSVQPGHYEMGFRAAEELERMMNSRRPRKTAKVVNIPPKRIVERESTRAVSPAEQLVERAKDYLRAHACEGIGPLDISSHLRCSRSLLYLHFRERTGTTLRAAIEARRLEEVKRLLTTTSRPLRTIARQCGFSSECRLSHLFAQRFGLSPRAWRKARQ